MVFFQSSTQASFRFLVSPTLRNDNMSSKKNSILKENIVVSFNGKNGTKVIKLARDFDIPRKTLRTS